MRTTHKRGFGRGAEPGGAAGASAPEKAMSLHRQPVPPERTTGARLARIATALLLALVAIGLGIGGGLFLWFHESLSALAPTTADLKRAEKQLHAALPGQPTIALVLGDNQRKGVEADAGGRSDTIMLVRADPTTHTITMLSLPRDLRVPVYCPDKNSTNSTESYLDQVTRIDYAFAFCGATGSLDTISRLTGLHFNYVITVGFTGFKEIVNDIGGIWLNIDRRYYNRNPGVVGGANDYSNINLLPGYQKLSGGSALEFVRYRHTDSDFYRQARDQEFLSALKSQLGKNVGPLNIVPIVNALTSNIEVAGDLSDSRVLGYALFALGLPAGHVLSDYISDTSVSSVNVGGADELYAPPSVIASAVYEFTHPDVSLARQANDAALGIKASKPKPKRKAAAKPPSPSKTTVTVLNGNGVAGAAANASYLLAERGYVTELPPGGAAANAPTQNYFDSAIYYDSAHAGAHSAASALSEILAPSVVEPLPHDAALRALDPGSMLLVVVGTTFHNQLETAPASSAPSHQTVVVKHVPAYVAYEPGVTEPELKPFVHKVPFQVELPTVLEASSSPDTLGNGYGNPPDIPARLYTIAPGHKAIVLVYHTADNQFWDIEETDWGGAPVFADRSFTHVLDGRSYQLYYNGSSLYMVLLHEGNAYYWVTNSLLNALSNETMIAIAKGLKPYPGAV